MKSLLIVKSVFTGILFLNLVAVQAQPNPPDSSGINKKIDSYPQIKGYTGLVHPVYTVSSAGNTMNFKDYYIVGNPWGINIWKSKRFGYSFEFTPYLRVDQNQSTVSNFLFHPGILYRLGHEYTAIGRIAYETSGRYGFTPIVNKVLIRTPSNTFFIALLLPVRFGNSHAASVTAAFQFGIGF